MPTHATMFLNRLHSNHLEHEASRIHHRPSSQPHPQGLTSGPPPGGGGGAQHPKQLPQYHLITPGTLTPMTGGGGGSDERPVSIYNPRSQPTHHTNGHGHPPLPNDAPSAHGTYYPHHHPPTNNTNTSSSSSSDPEAQQRRTSPHGHGGYGHYPPPNSVTAPPRGVYEDDANGRYTTNNRLGQQPHQRRRPGPHSGRSPFFPQMHEYKDLTRSHVPSRSQTQPLPLPHGHHHPHRSGRETNGRVLYPTHRTRSYDEYASQPTTPHESSSPSRSERHVRSRPVPYFPHPYHPPHPTPHECDPNPHHPTRTMPSGHHHPNSSPHPPPTPHVPHPQLQPRFRLSPQRRSDAPRPTGPPMLNNTFSRRESEEERMHHEGGGTNSSGSTSSSCGVYDGTTGVVGGGPPPPPLYEESPCSRDGYGSHPVKPLPEPTAAAMATVTVRTHDEHGPESETTPTTTNETVPSTIPNPPSSSERIPPLPTPEEDEDEEEEEPSPSQDSPPVTIRKNSGTETPSSPSSVSSASQYSGQEPSWRANGGDGMEVVVKEDCKGVKDTPSDTTTTEATNLHDSKTPSQSTNQTETNVHEDEKEMINDAMLLAEMAAMARREIKTTPATTSTITTSPRSPSKESELAPSEETGDTDVAVEGTESGAAHPHARKITPVNDQDPSKPTKSSSSSVPPVNASSCVTDVSSPVPSPSPKENTTGCCVPITPVSPSKIVSVPNPALTGTPRCETMPMDSDGVSDGAPRTPGGQGQVIVAPGSHYSRNGEGEAPGSHYSRNGEGGAVTGGATGRNEHGLQSTVRSPSLRNIHKPVPSRCSDREDEIHGTTETKRLQGPPPPLCLDASTHTVPPVGPGPHRGVPPHSRNRGYPPEGGSVHSSSSSGAFPPPNHARPGAGGPPPPNTSHCYDGGSSSGYHDRLPHHPQQSMHDGDDRWSEGGRPERMVGLIRRRHGSVASVHSADPMADERMEYEFGSAQPYHHRQHRSHLSVASGEVGRVSRTPPPSYGAEGFDEMYHHQMKRHHSLPQRHPHYGREEGGHEYYGNQGDEYGRPSKKAHVQFSHRSRERHYSGNDLNAMNSRDEYDDETYYPPPGYPPNSSNPPNTPKQQHRADDDRPHHPQAQPQPRQPPSNQGNVPPLPPQQHRYHPQQESYSPRSVGSSGPPRQPLRRGASTLSLGRTNSQEYYQSPGASGTMLPRGPGHSTRQRHGGPTQGREHMPPMEGGLSAGNCIKRQFETPVTPGTGGKVLDGTDGPQIIGEGMLPRRTSSCVMNGGDGPHYDEYRHSPSNWNSFSNGFHPNSNPSNSGHRSSGVKKTILRRKCAWKNYPELEAFLIANREEYLRHSAMNYTVQQKQYNNRLTERLLEVAASHNYIFDENDFNFVAVRDRIRCYYKSYVQSSKKRGIIVGYSAQQQSQQQAKKQKTSSENPVSNTDTAVDKEDDVECESSVAVGEDNIKAKDGPTDNNNNDDKDKDNKSTDRNKKEAKVSCDSQSAKSQHVNTVPEAITSSEAKI